MKGRRDDARIEDGSDTDSDKTQDGSCMPGLPHYRLRPDLLRRADVLAKAVRGLRVAEPTLGVTLLLANIRAGAEEESEAVAAGEGGTPLPASLAPSLACFGCARLPSDMDDGREKHEVCPICVQLNVPTTYWCCVNCPGNPGAWKRHAVYHKEVKLQVKRGFDRAWSHQAISKVADEQADLAEQSGDRYLQLLANGADYASRHDWRRACQRYREAIALRINLPEAYFNLALLLVPSGHLVEAAQWFLEAKERLPVDSTDWSTATACAFEMLRQEECNEVAKPEWWDDELLKVLSARVVRANETVASATGPAHRMRATVLCGLYGAWASPPRSTAELTEARMHFVSAAGLCTAAVGRAELETAATLCGQLALAISLAEAELAAEVKAEAERAVEVKAEAERAAARAARQREQRAAEAKLAEAALQQAASTVDLEGIRQAIAAHAAAAEGSSALRAAREARDRLAEQQRKAAKEAKQAAKRDQKRREEEARAADEEEAAATAAAVAEATAAERAAAHALAVERDGRVRAAAERVAAERAAAERAAAERAARDRLAEQQRQAAKEVKQAAKRDQKRREEEARAADEEKAAATAAAVVAERAAARVLAAEREQVRRATAKREAERSAAERAAAERAAAERVAEGARAQQAAEEARTMAEAIERSMTSLQASHPQPPPPLDADHLFPHVCSTIAHSPPHLSPPRPCAGRRGASQPRSTPRHAAVPPPRIRASTTTPRGGCRGRGRGRPDPPAMRRGRGGGRGHGCRRRRRGCRRRRRGYRCRHGCRCRHRHRCRRRHRRRRRRRPRRVGIRRARGRDLFLRPERARRCGWLRLRVPR